MIYHLPYVSKLLSYSMRQVERHFIISQSRHKVYLIDMIHMIPNIFCKLSSLTDPI